MARKNEKEAGIQFLDLNIDARQQIQSWIYAAAFRPGLPVEQGRFKIVWEIEEAEEAVSEPVPASPGSEFDSMFPSEKSLSPETFPGLNKPASLDAAIAPGPVKRPTGGLTAASSLSSYELPLVAPVRRAELDTEQGSRGLKTWLTAWLRTLLMRRPVTALLSTRVSRRLRPIGQIPAVTMFGAFGRPLSGRPADRIRKAPRGATHSHRRSWTNRRLAISAARHPVASQVQPRFRRFLRGL